MGFLSWIVFGLIAGAIAKLLHKGDDPGGWIVTILIGIAGAFLGGYLANLLLGWEKPATAGWSFQSFISSIIGAIILLALYRLFTKKKA